MLAVALNVSVVTCRCREQVSTFSLRFLQDWQDWGIRLRVLFTLSGLGEMSDCDVDFAWETVGAMSLIVRKFSSVARKDAQISR